MGTRRRRIIRRNLKPKHVRKKKLILWDLLCVRDFLQFSGFVIVSCLCVELTACGDHLWCYCSVSLRILGFARSCKLVREDFAAVPFKFTSTRNFPFLILYEEKSKKKIGYRSDFTMKMQSNYKPCESAIKCNYRWFSSCFSVVCEFRP